MLLSSVDSWLLTWLLVLVMESRHFNDTRKQTNYCKYFDGSSTPPAFWLCIKWSCWQIPEYCCSFPAIWQYTHHTYYRYWRQRVKVLSFVLWIYNNVRPCRTQMPWIWEDRSQPPHLLFHVKLSTTEWHIFLTAGYRGWKDCYIWTTMFHVLCKCP
jgi:hypothetical protein